MASTAAVGNLVVRLMGDASSFNRMLVAASAKARAMGRKMTTMLTAPLAIIGALAVREFARFDQAMTQSTAIMKVTGKQTARMRDLALELGKQGIQGPKELAESYFFLASAGLNAEESMASLPVVAKFATAGMFDMSRATDMLTDAQSALGMNIGTAQEKMLQMKRVGDVLVRANTLANASVEQFAEALTSKSAAAMKSYGKSVEEGVAVLAAFADQGVKASLAGETLNRFMLLLSKGAADNGAAMKKYKMKVFDANDQMRNMADVVDNLTKSLQGMSDLKRTIALQEMGFAARVQGAILPLLGTGEAIRKYQHELENATDYAANVAAKQLQSFSSQMKIMWNNVKVMAISIGELLAPALIKMNGWIKKATEWWGTLSAKTQKTIVVIAGVTAAIGPLLLGLAGIVSAVSFVVTTLGTIANPVGLAIAALAALTVAVVGVKYGWTDSLAAARNFFDKSMGFISNFTHNMRVLFKWIGDNWVYLLVNYIPKLYANFWKMTVSNQLTYLRLIMRLYTAFQGWIIGMFKRIFTKEFLNFAIKGIKLVIVKLAEFVKAGGKLLMGLFTGGLTGGIAGFIKQLEGDFEKGMTEINFAKTAGEIVKDEIGNLKTVFDMMPELEVEPPKFKFEGVKKAEQFLPDFGVLKNKNQSSMLDMYNDPKLVGEQVKATEEQAMKVSNLAILKDMWSGLSTGAQKQWSKTKTAFNRGSIHIKAQAREVEQAFAGVNQAVRGNSTEMFEMLAKVGQPQGGPGADPLGIPPQGKTITGQDAVMVLQTGFKNLSGKLSSLIKKKPIEVEGADLGGEA